MKLITRTLLLFILSFVFIEAPIVKNQAFASMITTQEVVNDLTLERQAIADFMQREDVKQELVKLGVSEDEANRRIASLSDKEVKDLSTQINQAQAGGILVAILLIVLIILVVKKL